MSENTIIPVLTGATASGKSALALRLGVQYGLELISADAMMVYREMDIGTAKPTLEEQARVPHHLIDVVAPDEPFSVARYVTQAERAIGEVLARGRLPLVVGGTGFYIRALTEGLPTTPRADPDVQRGLWERLEREGLASLERELMTLSPEDVARAQRNPRRVVRALEVWGRTGRSPASFPLTTPAYRYSKRLLEPSLPELEAAIARRTEAMFAAGLEDEVRRLLEHHPRATTALQAIGYKEIQESLNGETTSAEAKVAVFQATLRYAKRQRTWFRKEPRLEPLDPRDAEAWISSLQREFQPG